MEKETTVGRDTAVGGEVEGELGENDNHNVILK